MTQRDARRNFLRLAAVGAAAGALPEASAAPTGIVLPRALKPGDTLALLSPAGATYLHEPIDIAIDTLRSMGYRVKPGAHLRARRGHFAGSDAERAADLHAAFADPDVAGIIAYTGGSGCTRLLPLLDFDLIGRHPKFFGGLSDITVLLNAIQRRTGLVTFHSPAASSQWNAWSRDIFERIVVRGEAPTLANPKDAETLPAPRRFRTRTLTPGISRGRLVGGNLTVLATLAGTPWWPDFDGAILCLEDINEYIYRVDRVLAHLRAAGAFQRLAGVAIGQFTDCNPGDGYGTLTLEEVFADYFAGLGVPAYMGAQFGHVAEKMTLPIGLPAEIDATAGTLRLLGPAVRV